MTARVLSLAAALALLAACSGSEPGERFFASMNGANELPPNGGTSAGTADFTNHGTSVDYSITVLFITGVKSAGLYAGAADSNGPKIADLYTGPVTGAIASGTLVGGTLTGASFIGMSIDSALALMRTGKAYVNVTTSSLPNGEIRGQIGPN
jgi:hypothetical protein